ncbi:MAG TPA: glycosyltransferase [Planctomycetota bacterium]|nr:glycosyltransferase [Planctomycetota bacterium]
MTAAPRRFVHVFATFGAGGPQVRTVQLLAQLGPRYHHVVMAMDGRTEAAEMLRNVACEIAPPPRRRGFLATVSSQAAWLREQRPDLVLTYNWGAIETAAAARRLGLPRVHHEDGFGPEEAKRPLRRRSWVRTIVLRAAPVIVPSAVLVRIAAKHWRLLEDRVFLLPNGVDLQRFRPAAASDGALVVGTVGGLRAEKDHETLLEAVSRLVPLPRVRIVGGGVLDGTLRARAASLGLADAVDFAGPVADTAPSYAGFSVFALSSRTEQMPIALLEAMACGLPVVATDVGDVRAMLPPEQAEFVVPAGDPDALAAALRRQLQDAALRARLGAANRRQVEAKYEASACLDRFVRVYESLLPRS